MRRGIRVLRLFTGFWRKRIDWPEPRPANPAAKIEDHAEKIETRLLTILGMVNEWLQFAEAKNAGLVALDALGLAAILTILPSTAMPDVVAGGLMAASVLLLVSLGICLWSFLPRGDTGKLVPVSRRLPRDSDNFYFYGDVCGYQPDQLAAAIAHRYDKLRHYDPADHPSHVDLASQIVVNSRITVAKNELFRRATMLALLALVMVSGGVALSLPWPR